MANRLVKEKSPYLLQHAGNPVDWYPWSDEAFSKAAEEDKPIFLSIGYSTCHWCHVMERESFENEEVARLLNDTFVCIKVDREERPDIDNIYMTVCSMMTGGGGWPLTIIMTPGKKPFFAGTYFARETGHGRIGMLDLIPRIHDIWDNRREEVIQSSDNIWNILHEQNRISPGDELDRQILHDAFRELADRYDTFHGGFGKAPKFPTPHNINFLLRYWELTADSHPLTIAVNTLKSIRYGGIYDHIGFGFHRYSTDQEWLLPHFEKMLYDQALLATAYIETYQATGNLLFRQTAEDIFTYVLRDMTGSEGGFYSAEDADSEGIEGKFYIWNIEELQELLSPDELELICKLYNVKAEGNFHDEATGKLTGENIFHLSNPLSQTESTHVPISEKLVPIHENIRKKLFDYRKKRVPPHKDDKILTDWNGLMIGALAMGARVFDQKKYLQAAIKAAEFILQNMRYDKIKLLHRYREDEAAVKGLLNDYAYLVWGLIELYQTSFEPQILKEAVKINALMLDLFWDDKDGGFFLTPDDSESLSIRPKEIYDGALPSGNSMALANLLRLERLTGNGELGLKAKQTIQAFSISVSEVPGGYTHFLTGVHSSLTPSTEIVIVGNPDKHAVQEMLALCRKTFSPDRTIILKDPKADNKLLTEIAPFTAGYSTIDHKPTAYVCQNYSCKAPVTDTRRLLSILNNEKPTKKG